MPRYALMVGVTLVAFSVCAQEAPSEGPEAMRPSPAWMPAPEPAQVQGDPAQAQADSARAPAVSTHERDRGGRRWGVFSAGFSLWAVSYAADVGVSYGMGHASPGVSLIPIFGPLAQLGGSYQLADPKMAQGNAAIGQMISDGNHAYQSAIYAGLAVDAAVQLAGVITAIVGASTHTRRSIALVAQSGRGALSFAF